MQLIIMRHGEAGLHRQDSLRALTPRGEMESERVARAIGASVFRPAAIWCSSLIRAQQTAGIAARCLGLEVQEQPWLKPEDPVDGVIDALQRYQGSSPLLVVSHMPLVGALAGRLIESRATSIPMATSQAICLEMEIAAEACAEFRGQWCPEACR